MIGCLRTRVRKQPIIALYFESENELKADKGAVRQFLFQGNPEPVYSVGQLYCHE